MQLTNTDLIRKFIYAGNSTFTLRSTATGTRFTFKVSRADGDDDAPWFVKVLTGADNTSDYRYGGAIFPRNMAIVRKGKKGMDPAAPSMVALGWYLRNVGDERVEFFHQGSCCACGRALTVPESIATGFGPVCAQRNGVVYAEHTEVIAQLKAEQIVDEEHAQVDPSKVIPCRACNGTGLVMYTMNPCSICDGSGRRQAKPNPSYVGYSAHDQTIDALTVDPSDLDEEHDVDTCKCSDCFEARCESREAQHRSEYEMDYYSGNE